MRQSTWLRASVKFRSASLFESITLFMLRFLCLLLIRRLGKTMINLKTASAL